LRRGRWCRVLRKGLACFSNGKDRMAARPVRVKLDRGSRTSSPPAFAEPAGRSLLWRPHRVLAPASRSRRRMRLLRPVWARRIRPPAGKFRGIIKVIGRGVCCRRRLTPDGFHAAMSCPSKSSGDPRYGPPRGNERRSCRHSCRASCCCSQGQIQHPDKKRSRQRCRAPARTPPRRRARSQPLARMLGCVALFDL
jgi:hypothetical protein